MHEINWEKASGEKNDEGYPIKILLVPDHGSFMPHNHTFYEIAYVSEGFCLHFSDNEGRLLTAGDLVAIAPGQGHCYRCRGHLGIVNIMFLPEALSGLVDDVCKLPGMHDFLDGCPSLKVHIRLSFQDREKTKKIIDDFVDERNRRLPGWELRSKLLLADILVLMSRVLEPRLMDRQSKNSYMNYVMLAMKMIEDEYANALTVSGMAHTLGISPDHFTRQFKNITGFTPNEYLRRYRFAKALELLRSKKSIGEIAQETGFRDINYFSREFKAFFDMTPTQFREELRLAISPD